MLAWHDLKKRNTSKSLKPNKNTGLDDVLAYFSMTTLVFMTKRETFFPLQSLLLRIITYFNKGTASLCKEPEISLEIQRVNSGLSYKINLT